MGLKVLVTPRSFGKAGDGPAKLLAAQGLEIRRNPYGRIMSKAEMIREIADAEAVILGVDPLDREVLEQARKLKVIAKYGVGTDNIDLDYARSRGISVTTTAGANTEAVADYTFALLLAAARRVAAVDGACRRGDWSVSATVDVHGRTLGLVGLGQIGRAVVRRAAGFDMRVIAYDTIRDERFTASHGVVYTDTLEELLKEADFVSLHLPLTAETRHIIGAAELDCMKSRAVLINTARGGLVDEQALLKALQVGRLWGAGVDVFEQEPPVHPELAGLDNLVIGAHCAASTFCAVENMGMMAARHVIEHLCGEEVG